MWQKLYRILQILWSMFKSMEACINNNICKSCKENYYLESGTCHECAKNCFIFEADNCKCNTCEDGYYLENFQCLQCDSSCKKCLYSSNKCIQCNIDYYQKENDQLNSGEYIYCYKNPEGYYLDNDIYKI